MVNRVNLVHESDKSRFSSDFSNNLPLDVQASHPKSYVLLWSRQCIVVELGMILLSARAIWLSVQRDDGECSSLKMDKKSLLVSLTSGKRSWCGGEDPSVLVLDLGCPGLRRMHFLRTWSTPDNSTVPSAIEIKKVTIFGVVNTSFEIESPSYRISDASIFSNSSMSAIKMSTFQLPPAKLHNRRIFMVTLSCQADGVATNLWQK